MRAEFDLECFRRAMLGMTTRARVLESVGIGDCGCLVAGALAPALLNRLSPRARGATVPVFTGGAVAFVVDVAML
jgi:hypothetical protein